MKNPHWMQRTEMLLGEDLLQSLTQKHVLVVGLGGVGGICAEMIARSGVGTLTIIDADTVDPTNRNRQIIALKSNEQQLKTEVLAQRLLDINPELVLHIKTIFVDETTIDDILQNQHFDFAVDCIDTLASKVLFIEACVKNKLPLVSSMGAGGKIDPSQIKVADISKSYNCMLAQEVRKRLRKVRISKGFKVVFSPEYIDKSKVKVVENMQNKKSVIGTISYMPAMFGCTCASVVIRELIKDIIE
jgi:tRNA A37 threonylcarbamoyladenosine dehydratase